MRTAFSASRPISPATSPHGDADYLSVLDEADAYIARNGLDFPEPEARVILPDPPCMKDPVLSLDLAAAGVSTVIWATGYQLDFGWLQVPAFDDQGNPRHQRGVAEVPGLYFLGLAWLSRRASPFIWGVWHDAAYLADHIAGRGERGRGERGKATIRTASKASSLILTWIIISRRSFAAKSKQRTSCPISRPHRHPARDVCYTLDDRESLENKRGAASHDELERLQAPLVAVRDIEILANLVI